MEQGLKGSSDTFSRREDNVWCQCCHCHLWWQEWDIMVSLSCAQRSQLLFGKRSGVSHSDAHHWNTAQPTRSLNPGGRKHHQCLLLVGWELPQEHLLHTVAHVAAGSSLRISRSVLASPCIAMWRRTLKLVLWLHKVLADLQTRWTYLVSPFQCLESPS